MNYSIVSLLLSYRLTNYFINYIIYPMPLYEMVILMKINETQALGGFIKGFVNTVFQGGGILRNVRNLGERIAARQYRAKDGTKHDFVRFLSFEFDSDPATMKILMSQAKLGDDTLSVHIHKMNMNDYYKTMLDSEYFKKFENTEIDQNKENEFIIKNTAKEIIRKIKEEGKSEEEALMEFGIQKEIENSKLI